MQSAAQPWPRKSAEAKLISEKMPEPAAQNVPNQKFPDNQFLQTEKLETVGRIASSIAHDFNSLLTGVLLYCDLLREGIAPEDHLRRYVDEIHAAGTQAAGLVRQLLDLARPRQQTQRLLSLNEIVEGSRGLLSRLIGDHINLQCQLDPELGLINMDPTQVQQVLLNLVLNARDALPRGGAIVVETSNCNIQILATSRPGNPHAAVLPCVLFAVSDNGFGMNAETRKRVFEAFFTTKSPETGTGLGLATVYDIVTNTGGLVDIESEPGRGTRVTVLLPLAPQARLNALCSTDLQHAIAMNEGESAVTHEEPTP